MQNTDMEDTPPEIETKEDAVLYSQVQDDLNVQDDTEDEPHASTKFTITAYGADLSVFDLRRRLGKEILIPAPFQRKYVWTQRQASRFIESILMGLPVPGIFVFLKDKKQLIVDGQQRLITLDRFMSGVWDTASRRVGSQTVQVPVPFTLTDVATSWIGKTFEDLEQEDREQIENYLIHATIFRQDAPTERDRSIYEVFERINTGGLRLSAQEIRTCISHGNFVEHLNNLVSYAIWREVYGKRSPRMKDEELVIRFFAFLERRDSYKRPMSTFLDDYLDDKKNLDHVQFEQLASQFRGALDLLKASVDDRLFRPENALNAAVFDSVMVGVAARLQAGPVTNPASVGAAYRKLLKDEAFQGHYKRATADDENVRQRMSLAIDAFAGAP